MDYGKQTYLNTESLRDVYRRESVVSACVPAIKSVGGIRFRCEARTRITLEIEYRSLNGTYTAYFDGVRFALKSAPYMRLFLTAERGEHVFDSVLSGTSGGAVLTVSGVGVKEGRRYYERVGGYYSGSRIVVYTKSGTRAVEENLCESGGVTTTELTADLFDASLRYDKVNQAYTTDLATVSSTQPSECTVECGSTSQTIIADTLTSACIADGYGLPTGADYLVAYTDKDCVLHFCGCVHNGAVTESETTISGVLRVVSAQDGTMLFAESTEHVWRAYLFRAGGAKSLLVGELALPYDEIELTRDAVCTPCGLGASYPTAYCRNAAGLLVEREINGPDNSLAYADAFIPGATTGLFMSDNEMTFY